MSYLNVFYNPKLHAVTSTALTLVMSGGNYLIQPANPAAARTITLPDPGGNDSFVFASASQTLYNKTLGGVLNANSQKITNLATGTDPGDGVNLAQLQASTAGLVAKTSCRAATVTTLGSYTGSGTSTLTNAGTQVALSLDTVSLNDNDRVMIKDETAGNGKNNGLWSVYDKGSASTNWILKRVADFDAGKEAEGVYSFVAEGSANKAKGFIVTTEMPYALNVDSIAFTPFSAAVTYSAGNGIGIGSGIISASVDGTSVTNTGGTGTQLAVAGTYAGGSSIATVGTITTGTWHGDAVGDSYLATSYIKADGSRALSASWDAGAYYVKANNVLMGQAANQLNNADDATQNAASVAAFSIRGGDKTGTGSGTTGAGASLNLFGGSATGSGSTGDGGSILLAGGSSVGGGAGSVRIGDATDNTKLVKFALGSVTSGKTAILNFAHTNNQTIYFQDGTYTVVGRDTQDTLTNKTLTNPVINYTQVDKSASYSITAADESVNFTTGASALSAYLPAGSAVTKGKRFTIRKIDDGAGSVTIVPDGSDSVALTSAVIDSKWACITVESNGGTPTVWYGV